MKMKLKNAKFCPTCEEIFETELRCPGCDNDIYVPLSRWIVPLEKATEYVHKVTRIKNGYDATQ